MASPPRSALLAVDLALRPYELLAMWRPASRRVALVVQDEVREGQPVQARIGVLGTGCAATILGRAASVRPHPVGLEVEVEPDGLRTNALLRLVDVASGARVGQDRRAPRLLAEVPAVVAREGRAVRTTTFAVSDNGCGVAWSEPFPRVGAPVEVQLGGGALVAHFFAEVCWTASTGAAPSAGLRFTSGDRETWAELLASLRRAGAPPA